MSRRKLYLCAAGLAVAAAICLICSIVLLQKNIRSYVSSNYSEYSRDIDGVNYSCTGSPARVARTLYDYQRPEALGLSGPTQYLRYSKDIVIVGPEGTRPCNIRVESLAAGYNHGTYIHLGPGFYPGSPAGGSGGSSGGPGGVK